ncbi:MAG: hypothetical protein QW687_00840 [Candidatus Hadarchaeales archaeon]
MKRNNFVFLIGKLVSFRKEKTSFGEAGWLTVATDLKALGGHHEVIVVDRKQLHEVDVAASNFPELEVCVHGYLAGGKVMAERIIFLINGEEREKLKTILEKRLDRE